MSPFCVSVGICDAVVGHQWSFLKVILFENQIQTTSTSPCRTQVQPAASFLVCSLIFIEYKLLQKGSQIFSEKCFINIHKSPIFMVKQNHHFILESKMNIFRTKNVSLDKTEMHRHLKLWDLILLGIGAMVGTGVFTPTRSTL